MNTDCFVKVWASSEIRLGLAMAVVARMRLFEANLHVIMPIPSIMTSDMMLLKEIRRVTQRWGELCESVNVLPGEGFHIGSKALAEELAKSDPYVVIDDDHLPIGKTWLEDGVRVLANHPEYVCLSSWSINGEVPEGRGDEWCWESECTGTPYFLRKGIIEPKRMPVGPLMSYDTTLSSFMRQKGKIGFLRNVRHNHIGFGFSQVIPGWWKA